MKAWLVFLIGGLATYAMRGSFLLFGQGLKLPTWTSRPLSYVAPAAFSAITVLAVTGDEGVSSLLRPTAEVWGVAAAIVVVWRARNLSVALMVGLGVWWIVAGVL